MNRDSHSIFETYKKSSAKQEIIQEGLFDRLVANSDTINSLDTNLNAILDQMITDNLLTLEEKSLIINRQGRTYRKKHIIGILLKFRSSLLSIDIFHCQTLQIEIRTQFID